MKSRGKPQKNRRCNKFAKNDAHRCPPADKLQQQSKNHPQGQLDLAQFTRFEVRRRSLSAGKWAANRVRLATPMLCKVRCRWTLKAPLETQECRRFRIRGAGLQHCNDLILTKCEVSPGSDARPHRSANRRRAIRGYPDFAGQVSWDISQSVSHMFEVTRGQVAFRCRLKRRFALLQRSLSPRAEFAPAPAAKC